MQCEGTDGRGMVGTGRKDDERTQGLPRLECGQVVDECGTGTIRNER